MIISKLLAEIEMLNKKDFVEFHSEYVKMLKKKKKQNEGYPVGSSCVLQAKSLEDCNEKFRTLPAHICIDIID